MSHYDLMFLKYYLLFNDRSLFTIERSEFTFLMDRAVFWQLSLIMISHFISRALIYFKKFEDNLRSLTIKVKMV